MPDAFIYDHVRTPRGRGKADGALHEVTALNLAAQALAAIKDRNKLDPAQLDDVVMGCVDPVGEAGGDIARAAALVAGFGDGVPGIQINRFCASGLGRGEFRLGADHVGPARDGDRRRRRIHEPRRHRRRRRRLAGRSLDRGRDLLSAAGHFRRSDRHKIRLLARRRGRLRGREPEARRQILGGGPLQEFGDGGEGLQRAHHSGQGRAHAARHHHADAGAVAALVRADGRDGRLRRGRGAALPGSRGGQPRPHARAIPPASSTAPPPCWSAARRPASAPA